MRPTGYEVLAEISSISGSQTQPLLPSYYRIRESLWHQTEAAQRASYSIPWASIASATLTKPAMLAPST